MIEAPKPRSAAQQVRYNLAWVQPRPKGPLFQTNAFIRLVSWKVNMGMTLAAGAAPRHGGWLLEALRAPGNAGVARAKEVKHEG